MSMVKLLKSETDKNFGLTEIQFNKMVRLLKQGDESLFRHVFLSHFDSCMAYLKNKCSATHEDAYDASMDTLVEFHKRLLADKVSYGNLRFLFTRMAVQIYWKWIKKENLNKDLEGFDLGEELPQLDAETLMILNKAWEKLGDNCREILQAFYYESTNLKELAEKMEKSHAALRKQKERCVTVLRSNFKRWYAQ